MTLQGVIPFVSEAQTRVVHDIGVLLRVYIAVLHRMWY